MDKRHLGYQLPDLTVTVEAERLAFFAKAIGEDEAKLLGEAVVAR